MTILEHLIGLIIAWLIWPGLMFVVALIGESRVLPLWKKQSKAFIPGDLALSIIVLNCYAFWHSEYAPGAKNFWYKFTFTPWVTVLIGVLVVCIGVFLHTNDCKNYPKRAANSPTKWVHDIMGYFVLLFLIAWFVPSTIFVEFTVYGITNVLWGAFYVFMIILDMSIGFNNETVYARHPSDWQPIWKTKKIVKYQYRPQTESTPSKPNE